MITHSQEERIAQLEEQVAQLQDSLIQNNDAMLAINRTLVELTADHIQRLFNDDVMIDSIAQRVFIAAANAIAFKAKQSKQRAPEMVVVEGYVPGSIRVTLTEDGPLVEEQHTATQEWLSGDAVSEGLRDSKVQHAMGDLVISYGGEIGRPYYIIDSISLEEFRKEASKQAMAVTAATGANEEPAGE